MHASKTELGSKTDTAPNTFLRSYKVSEAFAYPGQAGKVCYVQDGDIAEDVAQDFLGEIADGTRGCRGSLDYGRGRDDDEALEARDEVADGLGGRRFDWGGGPC